MCGIAGYINYERSVIDQNNIIRTMTNTLVNRGPDDHGYYYSKHALLGHRRLIVVDPEGGIQPMSREYGPYKYTIVYNGELYNTDEIRNELKAKGHYFTSHSDTEVLLVSYIEWGADCVEYLNGIYAFAIWEEHNQSLFIARDRLGVKPLFYVEGSHYFIFGSEIKAILAHPYIQPQLDEKGIMELFGLGPARSLGSGVFKNIKELKPGEFIFYSKDKKVQEIYWKLHTKPHEESLQDTIEHTKELFVDAVKRQLVSDVPVCTFLSGGLDSSAISAIAAREFKERGETLHTFSVDYQDNEKYYEYSSFQPDLDSHWIQIMTDFIGSTHHNVVLSNKDLVTSLDRAVLANDLPGMADVDSSLYLFCKEIKKQATVGLSGECADEIFGGYPWFRKEEDIYYDSFPWSKSIKERCALLSPEYSKLDLPGYVQEQYQKTIDEVEPLETETVREYKIRRLFYLNMKWFMITLLTRKDRMSMANSLEVRVPFADHRIVEYAWNIPWTMKNLNNREKGLLRESLKGILPDSIIERKKSPYPKTYHPIYTEFVQETMKKIINRPSSPILQLVDHNVVKELVKTGGGSFTTPWFGQLMKGPQLLAYLIQINTWLETYHVEIIS